MADKYLNQVKLAASVAPTNTAIVTGDDGTVIANKAQGQLNAIKQTNGILFGTGSSIRAAIASDFPTLNQNTSGTAAKATNLVGGGVARIPYQSAPNTTLFGTIASGNIAVTNGSGTITNSTAFPAVDIGTNCTCTDPTTSTENTINIGLSHIYTNILSIPNPLTLAKGGTNANLTAANGAVLYSGASALALSSATATANQVLLSGASTAPTWSTATYPATITANNLLFSSADNALGGLATANTSILGNNTSGAPYTVQWSSNFPLVNISGCICTDPVTGSTTAGLGDVITNLGFVTHSSGYNTSISIDTTLTTAQQIISYSTVNCSGTYMLCGSCYLNLTAKSGDIGKTLVAKIYAYNSTTSATIANTTREIFSGVVVNGTETFGGTASFCVPITIPSQTSYTYIMYIQFTTGTAINDTCTGNAWMSNSSL